MLNLALVLFVAAVVAALSGLGSIATSSGVAQVLFSSSWPCFSRR